jgi:hypothetical protein
MPEVRSFVQTLSDLRRGDLLTELTEQLAELVAAVRATGSGGTLTLTLGVQPAAKGDVGLLFVSDRVTIKLPTAERQPTILYSTADNTLTRRDPRQPDLAGMPGLRGPTPMADFKSAQAGDREETA